MSFTEAATAELRGRIRSRLVQAADALGTGATTHPDADLAAIVAVRGGKERAERVRRLRAAVADFDAATLTTIHGFCSRLVSHHAAPSGVVTDGLVDIDEVVNDLLLRRYGDDPSAAAEGLARRLGGAHAHGDAGRRHAAGPGGG